MILQKFWKKEGYEAAIENITKQIDYMMNIPAHDTILTRNIIDNLIFLRDCYKKEMKEKGF